MSQFAWVLYTGRDREGESFAIYCCLHGSGRILAKVLAPAAPGEFVYRVQFHCGIPKRLLADDNEAFDFVDCESAKCFAENILSQFDPTGAPEKAEASA